MAPLLRPSFLGLRRLVSSPYLSSQRELLKPPESNSIFRRWYGENAALEETCSSTSQTDSAGESRAVVQGEDLSKVVDAHVLAHEQGSLKETSAANPVKKESATNEPSSEANTDPLISEIIGKLRIKNNFNGSKDNGVVPPQTESTSSKGNKPAEGSIREDKFKQVVNSMRKLAVKRNAELASGGGPVSDSAKTEEGANQDDFADLDLPQGRGDAAPFKGSNNSESIPRSAVDSFRNSALHGKPKEGGFQGPNAKQKDNGFQQKVKEAKPVSFSFLKSLEAKPDSLSFLKSLEAKPDSFLKSVPDRWSLLDDERSFNDDESFFSSHTNTVKGSVSNLRSTLQNLQPASFNSLKSVRAKNEPSHDAKNASSHDVKNAFSHEAKRVSSHESKGAFMERPSPSNTNEAINRTTCPGYTVCIRNLPSHSNLALVKESLSLHGEVIGSYKKSNSDGSCNAFVEFKMADAMDGALTSRWVYLDSKAFSIVRADAPITTVVRVSKVSTDTTNSQLGTICEKFGGLDSIKRRANGVYDVYYRANELSNMSTILDSLNEVTLNQSRLVALPAPLLHPAMRKEVLKGSEGQAWHASQLSQTLDKIERGLDLVSLCFEDLKILTAMEDELTK